MYIEVHGELTDIPIFSYLDSASMQPSTSPEDIFGHLWHEVTFDIRFREAGDSFAVNKIYRLVRAGMYAGILTWNQAHELYNQSCGGNYLSVGDYKNWWNLLSGQRVSVGDGMEQFRSDIRADWHRTVMQLDWGDSVSSHAVAMMEFAVTTHDRHARTYAKKAVLELRDAIAPPLPKEYAGRAPYELVRFHAYDRLQGGFVGRVYPDEVIACSRLMHDAGYTGQSSDVHGILEKKMNQMLLVPEKESRLGHARQNSARLARMLVNSPYATKEMRSALISELRKRQDIIDLRDFVELSIETYLLNNQLDLAIDIYREFQSVSMHAIGRLVRYALKSQNPEDLLRVNSLHNVFIDQHWEMRSTMNLSDMFSRSEFKDILQREWRRVFHIEASRILGEDISYIHHPRIQERLVMNPSYYLFCLSDLLDNARKSGDERAFDLLRNMIPDVFIAVSENRQDDNEAAMDLHEALLIAQ